MVIIMLQEHYLLKDINPKSEKDKWVFNNIFHILDIFDKQNKIKEVRIKDIDNRLGYLETQKWNTKRGKMIKRYKNNILVLQKSLIEECWQDQQEDEDIVLNFLFLIVIHEIAHLRFSKHSKRFARHYSNMAYKWWGILSNKTTKELRKSDKNSLYKWIRRDSKWR